MMPICRVWKTACQAQSRNIDASYDGKVLSFADFTACRLLRVSPSLKPKGRVYHALFELAKDYLKADIDAVSQCIAKYGLDTLLGDKSDTAAKPVNKVTLVRDLLFLLENLLLEYLGQNWDHIEDMFQANRQISLDRAPSEYNISKWMSVASGASRKRMRAQKNWSKAYRYAIKEVVLKTLGVQRRFSTLAQIFTQLHGHPSQANLKIQDRQDGQPRSRPPILLMLGGGMAAGKSTVREIIGTDEYWSKVGKDAVVIEADAIKNQDVVYTALKERLGDDPAVSQFVHEYSTSAAEGMLVSAINCQKDVIFDGTMTWLPFVEQTIAMVRDHEHNYKKGRGYYHDEIGRACESYWEIDVNNPVVSGSKIPYQIELVGVTCDPGLAVARGIWRKLRTDRGVPISSQIRSHRLFSQNFKSMAKLVDRGTLYHTVTATKTSNHPKFVTSIESCRKEASLVMQIICRSNESSHGELIIECQEKWRAFEHLKYLDDKATYVLTLYRVDANDHALIGTGPLERTITSKIQDTDIMTWRQNLQQAHTEDTLLEEESQDI